MRILAYRLCPFATVRADRSSASMGPLRIPERDAAQNDAIRTIVIIIAKRNRY